MLFEFFHFEIWAEQGNCDMILLSESEQLTCPKATLLLREQKTPVLADLDLLRNWGWSDEQIVLRVTKTKTTRPHIRFESLPGTSQIR